MKTAEAQAKQVKNFLFNWQWKEEEKKLKTKVEQQKNLTALIKYFINAACNLY